MTNEDKSSLTDPYYAKLLKLILKLIREKQTAVLFVQKSQSAFIVFCDGVIIGVACDGYHGRKAIRAIRKIKSQFDCLLQPGKLPAVKQDLGSMSQTLIDFGFMTKDQGQQARSATSTAEKKKSGNKLDRPLFERTHLDDYFRALMSHCFASSLGSFVDQLIVDAEQKSGGWDARDQLDIILNDLALTLDDPTLRESVVDQANVLLDQVLSFHSSAIILQELTGMIGSRASGLWENQMNQLQKGLIHPCQLEVLIENLASELSDNEQEELFIKHVMAALDKLF